MKLPTTMTVEELEPFVKQGRWIAKLATQTRTNRCAFTPLTYAVEDAEIVFSTWENSDAVRNIRRDGRASVPHRQGRRAVSRASHYTGRAPRAVRDNHTRGARELFGRYNGDENPRPRRNHQVPDQPGSGPTGPRSASVPTNGRHLGLQQDLARTSTPDCQQV